MLAVFVATLLFAVAGEGVREAPPAPPPAPAPVLTRPPALAEFHPAAYPPEALAQGLQADVATLVDIAADGSVAGVTLEKGASPEFDAAALAAIRTFRFSPAEIDGKPAPVRIRYVYHFVIEKKPAQAAPPPDDPDLGRVTGLVREAGTRRPLAGADVTLEVRAAPEPEKEAAEPKPGAKREPEAPPAQVLSATTDGKGRFALEGVPAGRRRVRAGAAGFAEGSARVALEKRGSAEVTITLRRTEPGELEATVVGERAKEAPTRRSLTQAELRNVPGSLNDPIRAVQNLPGLARAPFISGALLVRGSPPADTGIYLDGDKIPLLFHFLGGPSVVNEQMLERIDFFPGGMGPYYGRSLVGAIDVGTRPGDGGGVHGEVSVDLAQSVGFLEAPLGERTRVAAAARRSYVDLLLPLFLPNDPKSGVTTLTPVFWDYQARLDHKTEGGDQLYLLAFGSDDSLALVQTGPKLAQPISADSHIAFHRLHGAWRRALGPGLSLTVAPAIGWALTSFSTSGTGVGTFGGAQSGNLTDLAMGLRADLRWQARPWLQLRAGFDGLVDRYGVSADLLLPAQVRTLGPAIPEEVHVERAQPFTQLGQFLEADLKLGPVQLVPGLRLDSIHWRKTTRLAVDPRLWARWEPTPRDALKAYVGLYHQPPSALQVDELVGNPAIDLQKAVQVGLGWERRFSDVWSASADLFYNRKSDLIYTGKAQVLPDGSVYNPRLVNTGIGRAYGLELLVRREITSTLYGWLAYTLSKAEILRRPGEQWGAFQYDQPHLLTLVLGWRPSVGWELSTRFRFTSGNPSAPVLGSVFDADTGRYLDDRGVFGAAREPDFAQLDVRGQYTWTWDLFRLSLYLDVQNVTNRTNAEFHLWDYRFRHDGSISGLPILPTFGLSGRW